MSNVFEGTRFCIHTFGCQMNKHDSERVAGMLEGLGSLPVETIEEADIVVFMTLRPRGCRHEALRAGRLHEEHPLARRHAP